MISLRNFFITFLIALLVFGVSAYYITGFVVDSIQGLMSGEQATDTTVETEQAGPGDDDTKVDVPLPDIEGESFNILLVGTDYRPSVYTDYSPGVASQYPMFSSSAGLIGDGSDLPEFPYRTVSADAIVLVCVNEEGRKVACINIPSEAKIDYRGDATDLGDLYYEMGFNVFKNKISAITGVEIDYYAITSVEQIANVVNVIGPVNYTVPCDMEYLDESSGIQISLKAGNQSINGQKAAELLSFKTYPDLTNTRAQTTLSFLVALAKKATEPANFANAFSVFNNLEKYLTTNVTAADLAKNQTLIFSLATQFKNAKENFEFVEYVYPLNSGGGPNTNVAISDISELTGK